MTASSLATTETIETSASTRQPSENESGTPAGIRVVEDLSKDTVFVPGNKVLLLEDDGAFTEIVSDLLKDSGFEVTAAKNGVEGVHFVMASDFEIILCDMMMPTLPGDMFFRAVERMRPHLCDRFVFMTGHRDNQKINDFIKFVGGTILNKPFQMEELLETIAFVRVRSTLLLAA